MLKLSQRRIGVRRGYVQVLVKGAVDAARARVRLDMISAYARKMRKYKIDSSYCNHE
jgi:hypothetical protein